MISVRMPARIIDRHVGGNTTYARNIEAGLLERGHEVLRIPAGKNALSTMLKETYVGLKKVPSGEILHYAADTGPLLPTRGPSIVTVHGVASRWISTARSKRQEALWRLRVDRAIKSTNRVITVSESSARDVASIFQLAQESISVIPHGIDAATFRIPRLLSEKVACRVPSEFVLYLGNVEPRKNLLALVQAFQDPRIRQLQLPLVIAGRPAWNFEASMNAIGEAENVIHLGFVSDEDRVALMQSCTAFAFPSLYEGFGFPVLEAMAAGAVVVTTDRGSLAEVAGPALRFRGTEPQELVEGLLTAITDTAARQKMNRASADWVKTFSWNNSVDKHIAIYNEVLGL